MQLDTSLLIAIVTGLFTIVGLMVKIAWNLAKLSDKVEQIPDIDKKITTLEREFHKYQIESLKSQKIIGCPHD